MKSSRGTDSCIPLCSRPTCSATKIMWKETSRRRSWRPGKCGPSTLGKARLCLGVSGLLLLALGSRPSWRYFRRCLGDRPVPPLTSSTAHPDRLLGGRRVAVGAPSALSPAGWRRGPDGIHDAMSLSLRRGRHQTSGSGRAPSAPLLPRGGRPPSSRRSRQCRRTAPQHSILHTVLLGPLWAEPHVPGCRRF